jgi:hypothetical protein
MFGIRSTLFGMLVGGGAMMFAHRYHVVYTADGLIVVPRTQRVGLLDTYADTRGWDAARWSERPQLAEAMLHVGRGDLMIRGTASGLMNDVQNSLGVSQPLPSWDPSGDAASQTQAMPEIVYRKPESIPAHSTTATPSREDSLLNRLSRQFGGASDAQQPPPTTEQIQERPLNRERQRQEYRDLMPARPTTNLDDRAAGPAPLHTTALDRAVMADLGVLGDFPGKYREIVRSVTPPKVDQPVIARGTTAAPMRSQLQPQITKPQTEITQSFPEIQLPATSPIAAMPRAAQAPVAPLAETGSPVATPAMTPAAAPAPPVVTIAAMPPEVQREVADASRTASRRAREPGSDAYFGRPLTGVTPHLRERLPPAISTPLRSLSSPGMPVEGEIRSY